MQGFRWENIDSKLNKLQGTLQTFMLAPLLFLNVLVPLKKREMYQTLYIRFSTILGCHLRILLPINEGYISDIICYLILYHKNISIH